MSFISAGFFLILAITAFVYYLVPKKYQWIVLLIMSISFYTASQTKFLFYILFTGLSTYVAGVRIGLSVSKKRRKMWLLLALFSNFGILVALKYLNFFVENLNALLSVVPGSTPIHPFTLLLPLGVSFYTFQSMSYVIDVYQKKYEYEKNPFKILLFTSFLPQLLQGPIGRYDRLAPQYFNGQKFDLKQVEYGVQRILWGLGKKMIIADRANAVVTSIFSRLDIYQGAYIVLGLLMYSVELYCDFSGGIDVVIGAAEVFGIKFDENFRQPYFSKDIGEFWRRWHITLGTWMKDYIFYPFSISKHMLTFGKWCRKKFGKNIGKVVPIAIANLLVFFVVGVWHGANWKYILYGVYNGVIIAASALLKPVYGKCRTALHINVKSKGWMGFQMLRTFILVNISWFFDICKDAGEAFYAFGLMFKNFNVQALFTGNLLKMGLNLRDYKVLGIGLLILLISSIMKERGINLRDFVADRPLPVRWALYFILVFATAPFGFVGAGSNFIYAQF